jgi:hypothetical protein
MSSKEQKPHPILDLGSKIQVRSLEDLRRWHAVVERLRAGGVSAAKQRGLVWWVTTILAPIGVLGGPITIASITSAMVAWHGPVGYLVHFWSENIGAPFATMFALIAQWVRLPAPPSWLTDYLTLGVILAGGNMRAAAIGRPYLRDWYWTHFVDALDRHTSDEAEQEQLKRAIVSEFDEHYGFIFNNRPLQLVVLALAFPFFVLIWPLTAVIQLISALRESLIALGVATRNADGPVRSSLDQIALVLAPFALFVVLYGLNLAFG